MCCLYISYAFGYYSANPSFSRGFFSNIGMSNQSSGDQSGSGLIGIGNGNDGKKQFVNLKVST
jgi:hypothetical protein